MSALEGKVAIIDDGGSEHGRAIALALSARGVAIVVCGPTEKPLGETVGHVVYAGGKARHVVGSIEDAKKRAMEVFGRADVILDADRSAELVVLALNADAESRTLKAER